MIRVTCISDTHLRHRELTLSGGDVLIHAGDILQFTRNFRRSLEEFKDFLDWLETVPYTYKIFIGGNHDLLLDNKYCNESRVPKLLETRCQGQNGVYYLHNRNLDLDISGYSLRVYGNSATGFKGMAFDTIDETTYSGLDVLRTDIVVTHPPPKGYLDGGLGSEVLRDMLESSSRVKLHVFGHIHECHGTLKKESGITLVNAAIGDLEHSPVHVEIS